MEHHEMYKNLPLLRLLANESTFLSMLYLTDGMNITQLKQKTKMSMSGQTNLTKQLSKKGFIYKQLEGREQKMYLTTKGKKMKQQITELLEMAKVIHRD